MTWILILALVFGVVAACAPEEPPLKRKPVPEERG